MKLQSKILAGYIFIVIFFIIVNTVLIINIDSANSVSENLDKGIINLDNSLNLKELTSEILYLRILLEELTLDYILTHDDRFQQSYDSTEIKLHEVFDTAIKKSNPDDRIIFENLFETTNKIETTEKEMFNLVKEGKDAQALILLNDNEYHELTETVTDFIVMFSNRKQTQSEDVFSRLVDISNDIKEHKNNLNNLVDFTIYSILLVVVLSMVTGVLISRSISKPITKLKLAADLIRHGQFDFQIDSTIKKSNDEIEELEKSFHDMAISIQEKIVLERKLDASEEKVKNERLTAIGNLSSRLAHDLRNPLSVISTDFSIMKKKHPELDKDSVERIERGIDRIDHQVQSVLNFIKLKPSRLKNHSALELLKDVLGSMSIKKDIKINLPDNNSQILCDKEQCEILFYNIIFNAIQELEEKGGTISIRIIEQDDFVIIEFEDSGEGIPKENLDQIFDPLFTTKQSGTGLGLSSCKNIMEQFRGKISVELNPTIFTLVFPRKIKTKQN